MYNVEGINSLFRNDTNNDQREREKKKVCYARVSSSKQKRDLERQIENLKKHYPDHEIISDIGSGVNYRRKGFQAILERVYSGDNIGEVVITHKDRLCRYGI